MQFLITEYEFKNSNGDDWQNVSEAFVLEKLVDLFDPLTPVLSEMVQGIEIFTSEGVFRIKSCGNKGKDY
jgi:hypothetical protein